MERARRKPEWRGRLPRVRYVSAWQAPILVTHEEIAICMCHHVVAYLLCCCSRCRAWSRRLTWAVLSSWNYCSMDARALARFTFGLYDVEKSGYLTKVVQFGTHTDVHESRNALTVSPGPVPPAQEMIRVLVSEVYGDLFESQYQLRRIVQDAAEMKEGRLNLCESTQIQVPACRHCSRTCGAGTVRWIFAFFAVCLYPPAEFEDFAKKHAILLFPAFKMQQQMRAKIIGEPSSLWRRPS